MCVLRAMVGDGHEQEPHILQQEVNGPHLGLKIKKRPCKRVI